MGQLDKPQTNLPPRLANSALAFFMAFFGFQSAKALESYENLLHAISSPLPEYGLVLAKDGQTAVFARMSGPWGSSNNQSALYVTYQENGSWAEPRRLFSDLASNDDPFFSTDGHKLFFTTNNEQDGSSKPDSDIWVADYSNGQFSNPRPVDAINSPATEFSPIQTADGTLYFASSRQGGLGAGDIWRSRLKDGVFQKPENLGGPINTADGEWNVFLPPDASYLVVEASGREDGLSASGDMYLHQTENGQWKPPVSLRHVNTTGSDLMPRLSPDGRYMFFTSTGAKNSPNAEIRILPAADFLGQSNRFVQETLLAVSRSNHEVVALDPTTLEVLNRYPTGPGPHEVSISPDGTTAYAPNFGVYPKPHAEPILPSQMQFTSEPSDTLSIFKLSEPYERRSVSICSRSHGTTTSPDGHIWITCENDSEVLELNGKTGELIKSWDTNADGSHFIVSTRDNRHIIVANTDSGSITIIDRSLGSTKTIKTGKGAEGLALTPDQSHIWVGNAQGNSISIVRLSDGVQLRRFPSHGRFPVKLVIAPDYSEVWVVNTFSREIAILDGRTGSLMDKLTFDTPPLGIQISPDGKSVYATFPRVNQVRLFDRVTRQELARTDGVMEGDGLTWVPSNPVN